MQRLLMVLVFFGSLRAFSQEKLQLSVINSTFLTSGEEMPLWFRANQSGKIPGGLPVGNVSDIYLGQRYPVRPGNALSFSWGGNVVVALGEKRQYQVNQAFGGLTFRGWELKGGLFQDPVRYKGLSSSNGHMARSLNARPYPMIRFSTRGHKRLPFFSKWLSFRGEYDEGILNDPRYVDGVRMHHKSFYLRMEPDSSWKIRVGFDHFVMWGGTSPDERIGSMPSGFDAYLKYISGSSGDADFPQTDQLNKAGNQLGTYQIEVTRNLPEVDITFYVSHPFEDLSGVNWRNWPDNLLGLAFNLKNGQGWISGLVYEFTNTRQQSIRDSLYVFNESSGEWRREHTDSYFTHGVYRSGYTYHGMMMGSPLFFPVLLDEHGIPHGSRSLESTRFFAHHLGLSGTLPGHLNWKGLLTWIQHFGTYAQSYDPLHEQLSGFLEIDWVNPAFPLEIGLALGADAGNAIDTTPGIRLSLAKKW